MADDEEMQLFDSSSEIPAAMLNLTERVAILKNVVCLFKGWGSETAEFKSQTIMSLSNCKKDLNEIKACFQSLHFQLESFAAKGDDLNSLSHKMQFVLNNMPDRFNCPSNVTKTLKTDCKPDGLAKSSAPDTETKSVSNCSNIPELLFLTMDEFEKVPKYLKGRVTYEKINTFIELLNKVLLTKYSIFKKKKSTLKKKDADLWNEYNKQELKETKGLYFCVATDFKNLNGSVLDKASLNMLTILRHCGRVRELRAGGILRYVAMF